MPKKETKVKNYVFGSLAKATVNKEGQPIITVLASGTEVDKQGERCTEAFLDQFSEVAKAGKVFLVPSHDVPLPIAKSIDANRDDEGQMHITFGVEKSDPIGMRVHGLIAKGEMTPAVSIGAAKVKKSITGGIVQIEELVSGDDDLGVHVAMAFPGSEIYQGASVTSAMIKARKANDDAGDKPNVEELKKRGWSEEGIQKAWVGDEWIPPTFGERLASWRLYDELPELMDCLLWTVEDIMDPCTDGDKRALLEQSFAEFVDHVFGVIDDAGALKAKKDTNDGGTQKTGDEPDDTGDSPAAKIKKNIPDGCTHVADRDGTADLTKVAEILSKALTEGFDKVEKRMESLFKSEPKVDAAAAGDDGDPTTQPEVTEPDDGVEPPETGADAGDGADNGAAKDTGDGAGEPEPKSEPVTKADTKPEDAPGTGTKVDDEPESNLAARKGELEKRRDELQKALKTEDPSSAKRPNLIQELNVVNMRLNALV